MRILFFLLISVASFGQIPLWQLQYAPDSTKVIGAAADGEPIWVNKGGGNIGVDRIYIEGDSIYYNNGSNTYNLGLNVSCDELKTVTYVEGEYVYPSLSRSKCGDFGACTRTNIYIDDTWSLHYFDGSDWFLVYEDGDNSSTNEGIIIFDEYSTNRRASFRSTTNYSNRKDLIGDSTIYVFNNASGKIEFGVDTSLIGTITYINNVISDSLDALTFETDTALISQIVSDSIANKVGGTGSANKVAYWTGANTQSFNNNFHWDNSKTIMGIGTSAPSELPGWNGGKGLHLYDSGNLPFLHLSQPNNWGGFGLDNSRCYFYTGEALRFYYNKDIGNTQSSTWYNGNAEVQVFSLDGNNRAVIGPLPTITNVRAAIIGEGLSSSSYGLQVHNSTGLNNSFVVRDDGNIGISTNAPSRTLDINGEVRIRDLTTTTPTRITTNDADGVLSSVGAGTGITISGGNLVNTAPESTTVTDGTTIEFTRTIGDITAEVKANSIDSTHIKTSGIGTTDIADGVVKFAKLQNSGVTASTYNNVTVNNKGIVTSGSNVAYLTAETGDISAVTVSAPILGGGSTGSVNIAIDTTSTKGAATQYDLTLLPNQTLSQSITGTTQATYTLSNGGGSVADTTGFMRLETMSSTAGSRAYRYKSNLGSIMGLNEDPTLSGFSNIEILRTGNLMSFGLRTDNATNGKIYKYNGTRWALADDATGIGSLNTLTAATQTFATGTTGTDFNISSATSTHTFNFPNSSAANRGLLTSADWSAFNGKVGGSGTANAIPYWTSSTNLGSMPITYSTALPAMVVPTGNAIHLVGTSTIIDKGNSYGGAGKFLSKPGDNSGGVLWDNPTFTIRNGSTGSSTGFSILPGNILDIQAGSGVTVTPDFTNSGNPKFTIASTAGATNLAFSNAASPVILTSSSGADVTLTAGTNMTFSQASNNLTFTPATGATPTLVQEFTASGTYNVPAGAKMVYVKIIGGGGGGAGGSKGPNTGLVTSGGGGQGGGISEININPANLTTAVAITIGAGGTGGTGATVNGISGGNGSSGSNSSFGGYIIARGGAGGNSTTQQIGIGLGTIEDGGLGAFWNGLTIQSPSQCKSSPGGGGAGGYINNGALFNGFAFQGGVGPILVGGAFVGTPLLSGGGGSGGNASITGNGVAGSAAVNNYGGGGGGGGAALNSVGNGGNGGAGRQGSCIVITYF